MLISILIFSIMNFILNTLSLIVNFILLRRIIPLIKTIIKAQEQYVDLVIKSKT